MEKNICLESNSACLNAASSNAIEAARASEFVFSASCRLFSLSICNCVSSSNPRCIDSFSVSLVATSFSSCSRKYFALIFAILSLNCFSASTVVMWYLFSSFLSASNRYISCVISLASPSRMADSCRSCSFFSCAANCAAVNFRPSKRFAAASFSNCISSADFCLMKTSAFFFPSSASFVPNAISVTWFATCCARRSLAAPVRLSR